MGTIAKLLKKARSGPANLSFSDLCRLVEAAGFTMKRISGDHRIYAREGLEVIINLQPDKSGKAKKYQVKQVLEIVDCYGLLED